MPRFVRLDLSELLTYEVPAFLLALIAFPEHAPDSAKQSEVQVALVRHMFRSAAAADPTFAHKRIVTRWVYLQDGENKLTAIAARTYDRLRTNLHAVRVMRPFIQRALFGKDAPPLPADLTHLSLNAVTDWVTRRSPGSPDAHVFEQKVVRRLYPVLHLGVALEIVLHRIEQATGQTPKAELLMTGPNFTRDMIALAEQLEPVVLGIKQFKVVEKTQIRVRLLG